MIGDEYSHANPFGVDRRCDRQHVHAVHTFLFAVSPQVDQPDRAAPVWLDDEFGRAGDQPDRFRVLDNLALLFLRAGRRHFQDFEFEIKRMLASIADDDILAARPICLEHNLCAIQLHVPRRDCAEQQCAHEPVSK